MFRDAARELSEIKQNVNRNNKTKRVVCMRNEQSKYLILYSVFVIQQESTSQSSLYRYATLRFAFVYPPHPLESWLNTQALHLVAGFNAFLLF